MQGGSLMKHSCALAADVVRRSPASLCPSHLCMISFSPWASPRGVIHASFGWRDTAYVLLGTIFTLSLVKTKISFKEIKVWPGLAHANHNRTTPNFGSIFIFPEIPWEASSEVQKLALQWFSAGEWKSVSWKKHTSNSKPPSYVVQLTPSAQL